VSPIYSADETGFHNFFTFHAFIMPQSLGRQLLEQLIGKTVVEISHTDSDEIAAKTDMSLYLFFTDGTVLKAGPNTFQIFKPGQYQG
jgi:hypothetical protein